jgi:hypothetical protein
MMRGGAVPSRRQIPRSAAHDAASALTVAHMFSKVAASRITRAASAPVSSAGSNAEA